jgi:hypothetical protein
MMKDRAEIRSNEKEPCGKRQPYSPPAIIYEGLITTSSKTTGPESSGGGDANMDPADLFNG